MLENWPLIIKGISSFNWLILTKLSLSHIYSSSLSLASASFYYTRREEAALKLKTIEGVLNRRGSSL
jgi:hypothetical protein